MIDEALVIEHRARALSPDHPLIRGTAQNPDVYFQARETVNPFYAACPAIVQQAMDRFAQLTGRRGTSFEYHGNRRRARNCIDGLRLRGRSRDGRLSRHSKSESRVPRCGCTGRSTP